MTAKLTAFALFLLRVCTGLILLTGYGIAKLQNALAGNYEGFPDPIGLGSQLSQYGATFAEFLCAILLIIGLATRLSAAVLVFNFGVILFFHYQLGTAFFAEKVVGLSEEYPFLLTTSVDLPAIFILMCLVILLAGPGCWAFDGLFKKRD